MAAAKNVNGAIGNAIEKKEETSKTTPASVMNSIVNAESTKKLLQNTLKENAGSFSASIIDLYNSDKTLQECDPRQVMGEALKAASLKLPINKQLGFAYVIPYRDYKSGMQIPQFQLGYKGMIQLCMRTGSYRYINAGEVYEGELVKIDKLTGEVDLSGEAVSDKIVGYFAYMETVNGFKKAFYWSKEKTIAHANKYSKSYKNGNAIWRDNFDEMAIKTVLRNLLSHYGIMSVELIQAFTDESAEYAAGADSKLTEGNNGYSDSQNEAVMDEAPQGGPIQETILEAEIIK